MTASKKQTLAWFIGFVIASFLTLVYALKSYFLPIFGTIILIYLTKPLQKKLRSFGLSNVSSAFIISFALFSIICFLLLHGLPIILSELTKLLKQLPTNISTTYQNISTLLRPYDITLEPYDFSKAVTRILQKQDLSALQAVLPKLLSTTISRFVDIVLFFTSILFIPLFFFFMLQKSESINHTLLSIVPPIIREDVSYFLSIFHDTMSVWVTGQGTVIITLSILYTTGLSIIGIPYAISLGIITGVLYIIPVAGPLIGLCLSSITAISYAGIQSFFMIKVLALYATIHGIESMILSPFLIGNRLGLDLPSSLLVILIGGGLFGGMGVLLAIPTASIIKKLAIYVQKKQSEAWICD